MSAVAATGSPAQRSASTAKATPSTCAVSCSPTADANEPKDLRETLRDSACRRFTTVLGPGSDAYHEQHIHLDVLERRAGYRICQWDVREPAPPPAVVASREAVPLPPPRPAVADSRKL